MPGACRLCWTFGVGGVVPLPYPLCPGQKGAILQPAWVPWPGATAHCSNSGHLIPTPLPHCQEAWPSFLLQMFSGPQNLWSAWARLPWHLSQGLQASQGHLCLFSRLWPRTEILGPGHGGNAVQGESGVRRVKGGLPLSGSQEEGPCPCPAVFWGGNSGGQRPKWEEKEPSGMRGALRQPEPQMNNQSR